MAAPDAASPRIAPSGRWQTEWVKFAECQKQDPDALFVTGAQQQTAKAVCQRCSVIAECLADALDNKVEFGVWGGMTERERRALLRRRPNVSSWGSIFRAARLAEETAAS